MALAHTLNHVWSDDFAAAQTHDGHKVRLMMSFVHRQRLRTCRSRGSPSSGPAPETIRGLIDSLRLGAHHQATTLQCIMMIPAAAAF